MTKQEYKELKPKVRENKILMGSEIDIICEALEKQIPKKINVRKGCNWSYNCPCCNKTLYWTDEPRNHGEKTDYCPNCGQRLDWGVEE